MTHPRLRLLNPDGSPRPQWKPGGLARLVDGADPQGALQPDHWYPILGFDGRGNVYLDPGRELDPMLIGDHLLEILEITSAPDSSTKPPTHKE
jgi:hypothetical protein